MKDIFLFEMIFLGVLAIEALFWTLFTSFDDARNRNNSSYMFFALLPITAVLFLSGRFLSRKGYRLMGMSLLGLFGVGLFYGLGVSIYLFFKGELNTDYDYFDLAAWFFDPAIFMADWNGADIQTDGAPSSVMDQVRNTMLITLWVFTGIEGAAVLSKHARRRIDIGRATVFGVVLVLAMYVAITLLAQGVLPRAQIAAMSNPSMAGVLQHMVGHWGKVLISACLVVSVLSSYLSWTLYATEIPHMGAKNGAFPPSFIKLNRNEVPTGSLLFTTLTVQLCLFLVWQTGNSYEALLMISTSMILVPYLLIGAYLLKLSFTRNLNWTYKATGLIATPYALWIVYAAGVQYLLFSVLLYLPGVLLFLYSQRRHHGTWRFSTGDKVVLGVLAVLAVPALKQFWQGIAG